MFFHHRLQVAELQSTCAEKEQLLSERSRERQEKTSEIKTAEENISTLTEEKSQLILVLQGVREERDKLKREQLEKSETVREGSCSSLGSWFRSVS